jgi:Na+/H+-dicarboxylate symporter
VGSQILVAITALLASIGAAGIPHAGLVMMAIVLQAVGLPLEAQGIIIAVDRVLDMCRTTVNVWSDSCGCAVIDRLCGNTQNSSA